nr:integrase, catalytic region, zinc finger, CCHC-type, peptidase aspartic, catalytic [Tanacetum cinerariifolium]
MKLYIKNRKNGRMILNSVENGPLIWPTVKEIGETRKKKYEELSALEKLQADYDLKATNIVLYGLPLNVYAIVNHHKVSKEIWDIGETPYQYYWRFAQLINDMHILNMTMRPVQVNTKFLKNLLPEWSKFMMDATIQDDRVTMQQVQGRQVQRYAGTGYKGNATSSGANNAGGHTRVVKCYNYQAGISIDLGITDCHDVQPTIIHNASFQTDDLDDYDSDCDDISSTKAVLMANHLNYGLDVVSKVVQIVLLYLDYGFSKHMSENRSQLITFVLKFLGIVRFSNDQIAKIIRYEDYQLGNVTISWVYYVEGLGHNLFSVRQFCDSDLDVAFCKHTCHIRDLDVPTTVSLVFAYSTGTPSLTLVDQDAPSPRTSQTPQKIQASVLPSGVKEENPDIEVAYMDNDQHFSISIPELSSKESSS